RASKIALMNNHRPLPSLPRKRGRVRVGAFVFLLSLAVPISTHADTDREAQLARVRARLQSVQTELNATKVQRNAVREEVNALERKIGVLLNEQRATDKRL